MRTLIRSGMRKWPPWSDVLELFPRKEVHVDHITPCGSMDDLNVFVGRHFCEEDGLQVLCEGCNYAKGAD